jgi:predicted alpha/beta-hydrolase family hydrolase
LAETVDHPLVFITLEGKQIEGNPGECSVGEDSAMKHPESGHPELLIDDPFQSDRTLVLAHGAGAGMDADFMNVFADGLSRRGLRVVRFEFPYMATRRITGKRRPPDREPILRETWHSVLDSLKSDRVFIGGKSMGGRIASMIADEAGVTGLICLGYPFHPTGKPDRLRIEHLKSIETPTLIVQGERDPFGNIDEVADYPLSSSINMHWLTDGDHSFKPRKASGKSLDDNIAEAISCIITFVDSIS